MFKCIKFTLISLCCLIIAACTGVKLSDWHFPYMMEVQQGTYITKSQYNQLKSGMNKDQIAYIIGKPLTQYMFDQNRWDYSYQDYKNNNLKKKYSLTILFNTTGNSYSISKTGEFFDK
jgi:outer membrane protein assembly factor BamE